MSGGNGLVAASDPVLAAELSRPLPPPTHTWPATIGDAVKVGPVVGLIEEQPWCDTDDVVVRIEAGTPGKVVAVRRDLLVPTNRRHDGRPLFEVAS